MRKMFISDNPNLLIEGYFSYPTLATIGFSYQKHPDSLPRVFISKDITFKRAWRYFLEKRIKILNIGQIRFHEDVDCCLSIFYNPYFNDFYQQIKTDVNRIPKTKLKIIERQILQYLANSKTNLCLSDPAFLGHDFYIGNSVYEKSNELLSIIRSLK